MTPAMQKVFNSF